MLSPKYFGTLCFLASYCCHLISTKWAIDIRLILKAVSTQLYNTNDDEDK